MPAYSLTIKGDINLATLAYTQQIPDHKRKADGYRLRIWHSSPYETTVVIVSPCDLLPHIHSWYAVGDTGNPFADGTLLYFRLWSDAALTRAFEAGAEMYSECRDLPDVRDHAQDHADAAAAGELDCTPRLAAWLINEEDN